MSHEKQAPSDPQNQLVDRSEGPNPGASFLGRAAPCAGTFDRQQFRRGPRPAHLVTVFWSVVSPGAPVVCVSFTADLSF